MYSNLARPPRSGTVPSNLLKLRSLQEGNNVDVIIAEKKVYKMTVLLNTKCAQVKKSMNKNNFEKR